MYTCFDDECRKINNVLIQVEGKPYRWKCPTCEEIYNSCVNCSDGLDWSDNEKGFRCCECSRYWCNGLTCMDAMKSHFDGDEEMWCGDCWKNKKTMSQNKKLEKWDKFKKLRPSPYPLRKKELDPETKTN